MKKRFSPQRTQRTNCLFVSFLCVLCALCGKSSFASDTAYARIEGAKFHSVLPVSPKTKEVALKDFQLARTPVTNAAFLEFVRRNPQWQRGRAPALFADEGYLRQWAGPLNLGSADPQQPVVQVSWFAAQAYCEAQGVRLPTWHEWEWAAAADGKLTDARDDPAWRQQILNWYSEPGTGALPRVGRTAPNLYGVHDLHGLVWEWVDDFGAMMVSGDNREQGDPDLMKFCGTGALSMEQKENYAVLMRIAMLSSLKAAYTTANLGFRCAKDEAR